MAQRCDGVPWTQIVIAKLLAGTASLDGVSSQQIGDGRRTTVRLCSPTMAALRWPVRDGKELHGGV
jgi:hypothetical protein